MKPWTAAVIIALIFASSFAVMFRYQHYFNKWGTNQRFDRWTGNLECLEWTTPPPEPSNNPFDALVPPKPTTPPKKEWVNCDPR